MTSHTSRSRILLGVGGMTLIFPMLSMAEGFVDDTKATLTLRNAYFNRNFTNPAFPNSAAPQNKAEEWTQNFILDAKSGFTQGVVGFGVDVLGLYSLKLDGGKGTGGTQLL
ncbi:OprD family outer membrane protein, partial [Pseudomonas syringae pv. actinidiae str. M302091]